LAPSRRYHLVSSVSDASDALVMTKTKAIARNHCKKLGPIYLKSWLTMHKIVMQKLVLVWIEFQSLGRVKSMDNPLRFPRPSEKC